MTRTADDENDKYANGVRDQTPISEDLIRHASGHFDLTTITRLDLSGMNLRTTRGLEACVPSLVELDLSENLLGINSIRRGGGLSGLTTLIGMRYLDLSRNGLSEIPNDFMGRGVGTGHAGSVQSSLKRLRLDGNSISDEKSVSNLSALTGLVYLSFRGNSDGDGINPVCDSPDYVKLCLAALPALEFLDNRRVDLWEAAGFLRTPTSPDGRGCSRKAGDAVAVEAESLVLSARAARSGSWMAGVFGDDATADLSLKCYPSSSELERGVINLREARETFRGEVVRCRTAVEDAHR